MLNSEGRPTRPEAADGDAAARTFTGNRGLQIEEALIFETGRTDVTGVDIPDPPKVAGRLGAMRARRRSTCRA